MIVLSWYLQTLCDTTFSPVWILYYLDAVADKYPNTELAHAACKVGEHLSAVIEYHSKKGIRQCLLDGSDYEVLVV